MSLTLMLSAARLRHNDGPAFIKLSDVLTSTEGLSENTDGEYFAPVNQWGSSGAGKEYTFKPDPLDRKVKKITAKFRYVYDHREHASIMMFYHNVWGYPALLGVYDFMPNKDGFYVVDDTRPSGYTGPETTINETLTRTLSKPIPLKELVLRIGGRSEYTYTPIYISNLVFEYE